MSEIIYHFIILIMIIFFVIISLSNGEVIKLENMTHIHCIDDDFYNKEALFVSPPLKEIQTLQNNLISEYNNVNDWDLVNGNALGIAPITDKRWNDIPLNKNNYTHFNLNTSVSFSVYSPNGLEIFVYNYDYPLSYDKYNDEESKWYHYTVLSKNGTAYLFENNKIVAQDNFVPTNVVFRNLNKKFYFKKQDRKFWWSNKATENKEPSTVIIPPTGKSCLTLYTSLCEECYLEVIYNNEKTTITSINQQDNVMMSWQMQQLEINSYKENTLKIYRKINTSNSTGHWALDFSVCDSNNTVTYKKEEKSVNYTCNTLNIDFNKRAKRSSSNQEKLCPAGKLGRNCDISCENILNSNFRYCNKHKICKENTDCNCAWGYNGQFCNNLCEEGKWGLSCKEECKGCTSCDKHTGQCKTINNLVVTSVVLAVLVGVISLIIKLTLKRRQKTEQNTPETKRLNL